MKKYISLLLIMTCLVTTCLGCGDSASSQTSSHSDSDQLTVVATLFPQYDFAREIAGDKAEIILLLPPGMESHSFEPTPGDIITIHHSDIFLYTGDEMEPWVSGIVDNVEESEDKHDHTDGPIIADLSSGIELQKDVHNHVHDDEPCTDADHNHEDGYVHCDAEDEESHEHNSDDCDDESHEHDSNDCDDESHEHDSDDCDDESHEHDSNDCDDESHEHDSDDCDDESHEHDSELPMEEALIGSSHEHSYNPHIWTSPVLAMKMVENIVDAFVKADPDNASYYKANGSAYLEKLHELDHRFRHIVEEADFDTVYVGSKFSLLYFMEEYGLNYVAAYDSCEEEAEPSIKRVVSMIKSMTESGITSVYYQELIEPYIAETIAEATGGEMYLFHSCHNVSRDDLESGVTYLSLMEQNAVNLEKGLNR